MIPPGSVPVQNPPAPLITPAVCREFVNSPAPNIPDMIVDQIPMMMSEFDFTDADGENEYAAGKSLT